MPQPFSVRSQTNPGVDLGDWDNSGNITIPGTLTAANVVNQGAGAGGVQSVTNIDGTISVTGSGTNPVVSVNAIPESKVTNLTTDLAAKAPLAAPSFTGLLTSGGPLVVTPDTITYAASVTPDCSTGNLFRITLTGALTINAPINATDGQRITFELIQDNTGSRAVTFNATAFDFGTTIGAYSATTTGNARDFIGCIYNSVTAKFYVVALVQGY